MQDVVQWLKDNGNLKIIDEPLDVNLEIPHVAYVEVKERGFETVTFYQTSQQSKRHRV